MTSMASIETRITAPINNIIGNEFIIRGTHELMYYKKSPMPRSFLLPKLGNVADGVKTVSQTEDFVWVILLVVVVTVVV